MTEKITGYKGFDKDLKCKNHQFKVGETYQTDQVKICEKGFHFCEHPLDVFSYYPPAGSRFAEVEGAGKMEKHDEDTKVACSEIHIKGEISFHSMIEAAVKFVFDRAKWTNEKTADGDRGAASATGDSGAASVSGKESIACGLGIECKAKGKVGCWLVLAEWKDKNNDCNWTIKSMKTAKVDGKKIKDDTWYMLVNGKFTETI